MPVAGDDGVLAAEEPLCEAIAGAVAGAAPDCLPVEPPEAPLVPAARLQDTTVSGVDCWRDAKPPAIDEFVEVPVATLQSPVAVVNNLIAPGKPFLDAQTPFVAFQELDSADA